MTMYKDFVSDYPARCIDVINKFYGQAQAEDREVTLLLMAAAGGFLMPYERLQKGKKFRQPNLDRVAKEEQMGKLQNELEKKIRNSNIFGKTLSNWRYGFPGEEHNKREVIAVAERAEAIPQNKKVACAIKILRHSIAHGNVLAIESPSGHIQDLVFVSRNSKSTEDVVSVELIVLTPEDLKCFMLVWCDFLRGINQKTALRILDRVAS
jgi:hypothetical protein